MNPNKPLKNHSIFEKFLPLLNELNAAEFERVVKREIMEVNECTKEETEELYKQALEFQKTHHPSGVKHLSMPSKFVAVNRGCNN